MAGTDTPVSQSPRAHSQQQCEPLRFSVDHIPTADKLFGEGQRSKIFRNPFLHSVLFHLIILFLILGLLYCPDNRPVKKVDRWVVNIVTALEETSKSDPAPHRVHVLGQSLKPARLPDVFEKKAIPLGDTLQFHEFPLPAPESEQIEGKPIPPVHDPASQQVRMAPNLSQMRMGDPMLGLKMKYFHKSLADHVTALVQTSLQGRDIRDQFASMEISFRADGKIQYSLLSPESQGTLSEFLAGMEWGDLPSPSKYGLPFLAVKINVSVDPGRRVRVTFI